MQTIVLAKLQIACLLVTLFIGILYFSSSRQNTKLHKSFGHILIALPIYLLFDIGTVYTVNHRNTLSFWNDLCHRLFFFSITIVVFLFFHHMNAIVAEQEGVSKHQRLNNVISYVILFLTSAHSLFAPPAYGGTEVTEFAITSFAGGAFAAVGLYIVLIILLLIRHWRTIPKKKRLAISTALVIEAIGLYIQMRHTELLLSGSVLTLMMLAFYLTLENPDAILLEQVAAEKEKADAANASKSAFLSIVSHEIRTPMNAVVGMTELLLKDKEELTEKQEHYLQNIKTSGAALVTIVNDILDQSKIEAGKMEIIPEPYELRNLVDDVKMIIETRIGEQPIELRCEVDEKLPKVLLGDSIRIRQIMINLLNNAVKFTKEGWIRLLVTVQEEAEGKVFLRFSVQDTGQGIREEDLAKLGQAFTQVNTRENYGKEGTGLGLSISKDFISLMGGQLEVASEYGKGTEFFFSIWQGIVDESELAGLEEEEEEAFSAEGMKVLVVDDTEINLLIATELLEELHAQVATSTSGEGALSLLEKERFDIIFLDYIMGGMNGVETARCIREKATTEADADSRDYFAHVPLVALTGDVSAETVEKFTQAGVNAFAEKPIVQEELESILKQYGCGKA